MTLLNSLRLPALLLIVLGLTACGDDSCEWEDRCDGGSKVPSLDGGNASAGGGGSSTGGSGDGGNAESIDCDDLDSGKVYLHGSLNSGSFFETALVDPARPRDMCIGFPSPPEPGVITSDGRYIYGADGASFFAMKEDALETDANENWVYPDEADIISNDQLIADSDVSGAPEIRALVLSPEDTLYFQRETSSTVWPIYREDDPLTPYYTPASGTLLAALPGDQLMLYTAVGLMHVGADLVETPIDFPGGVTNLWVLSARMGGENTLWIAVYDPDLTRQDHRRLTVNLDTLTVTEDGAFQPPPENIRVYDTDRGLRMDSNGDLVQIGWTVAGGYPDDYVIVKRPLGATDSTTIYSEAVAPFMPWKQQGNPFVHVGGYAGYGTSLSGVHAKLVTGVTARGKTAGN